MSLEQYNNVCREQFEGINDKLDEIHKRLFIDNGSPCIQTRLDRNERMWKIMVWLVSLVCAASIAQVTRGFFGNIHADKVNEVIVNRSM